MRPIKTASLSATAAIALALLLQGCATSTDPLKEEVASRSCPAGEILICDTRSSGRISDGRFGRNSAGGGRRNRCGCEPERDLDGLAGFGLPRIEPH